MWRRWRHGGRIKWSDGDFDEDKLSYLPTGSGAILRAAEPRLTKHLGVTPLTEAAMRNLETRVAAGQDPGIHDAVSISAANARVADEINRVLPPSIQLTDITMIPILVGSASELNSLPSNGRGNYAKALATFALQAARFNPSLTAPALSFAQNLANDLTDGRIDDRDANGNPAAPASGAAYQSSTLARGLADALEDLADATTKTAIIPTTGGSIALPGTVGMTFASGAFTAPRQVTVSSVTIPELSQPFGQSAAIFSPSAEHTAQVTLQIVGEQPRSPIATNVSVPASFAGRIPDGSEIRVCYLNRSTNGNEILETFEPADARADKSASSIDVSLPLEAMAVTIVLRHTDGSATLYGHLRDGSATVANGATVKAGDTIALAGNTGTDGTATLHFEHAPNGKIFSAGTKGNPVPCFSTTATGSVAVSDNGSVADDAFSLSLNGSVVCTTTIGAANTCALGQLRPGTYDLVITVTIAPDNAGTFNITVSSPNMTVNGSKSVSGSIPQGASRTYSLVVT